MVHSTPRRLSPFVGALCGACALIATAGPAFSDFPKYDHVFLIIEENEDFSQVIDNKFAPILNALAADYGLATNYRGVADPSEPNYVAMLGGDFFGITSDDPYWFPGQSVDADTMDRIQRRLHRDRLRAAGKVLAEEEFHDIPRLDRYGRESQ